MSYDLVIKNGTVVDGTGAKRYQADVAIADGKVAEIGKVTEGAKRTIDADGLIVAPGFVDPHTHYDAQICWDGAVTPSSWHGVTSVVMGNCGVGIAPCRPETREVADMSLPVSCAMMRSTGPPGANWITTKETNKIPSKVGIIRRSRRRI